jgi:hypothetical protein
LGKLLLLPANVRLDWKVIARYKHSSLFGLVISNKGKRFYIIDTRVLLKCYDSNEGVHGSSSYVLPKFY